MTLSDLLSDLPDAEELRTLAIVMGDALAQRLVNVHHWYGDQRYSVFPVLLDDGRWASPAEILPECLTPGGMYHAGFSHLDASRFGDVEVVPWADVELADPQPPVLQPEPQPEP